MKKKLFTKKLFAIGMVVVLLLAGAAFALAQSSNTPTGTGGEDNGNSIALKPGSRWAKGTAQPAYTTHIFAGISGQASSFDYAIGDYIEKDESLISIRPIEVRAANDGVIRALQAQTGDQAANVTAQYNALCYIDRQDTHIVRANISGAYNKPENRAIVLGEALRIYNGKSGDPIETTGTVVAIIDNIYLVEIPADIFDLEASVKLYRGTGDSYKDKDLVGSGKTERTQPIPVMGEGVIANVLIEEGQAVKRGDVLFYMDQATTTHDSPAGLSVTAPEAGMLININVQQGQQVQKDQLLFSIQPIDDLELIVDVDEIDLPYIELGELLQVAIDVSPGQLYTGTVTEIGSYGSSVLDTTKYAVTIKLAQMPELLKPGMHVTAYWD